MKNEEDNIFQSLGDKLEQKEFTYNPTHWEAAKKLIPSNSSFIWNSKSIIGLGVSIILMGSFLYFSLDSKTKTSQRLIAKKTIIQPIKVEKTKNKSDQEITNEIKSVKKIKPLTTQKNIEDKVVVKEIKKSKSIEKVKKSEDIPIENYLGKSLVVEEEPMSDEEFVEFIAENEMQNNSPSISKIIDDKQVQISPIIPNIFTPNNDGYNDYFTIENIDKGDWGLVIFNQSGEIVFETTQYKNTWDGKNTKDGTYIYKLYNSKSNYQSSGLVELKR